MSVYLGLTLELMIFLKILNIKKYTCTTTWGVKVG